MHADDEYTPIFAGTQLAFYAENIPPAHISVNPYFTYLNRYGQYNSHWREEPRKTIHDFSILLALETGLTEWLDLSLDLNGAYRRYGHKNSWVVGDTTLYLGFQLSRDIKDHWTPDFRILLGETFPSGKYDRLSPSKGGSDIFGAGAYSTSLIVVIAKTFYNLHHPYNINLNLYYTESTSVPLHGLSVYGGTSSTRGHAHPGSNITVNLALEYSLTQLWALGLDIHYIHQNRTQVKTPSKSYLPSFDQFSLAPCLEYSWSSNFSVGIGPWFTIAGRNSQAFAGVLGNIYIYF